MSRLTRLALPAILALSGCTDLSGPGRGDPAQYLLPQSARFVCNQWVGSPPPVSLGLFDVYFGSQNQGPTDKQIRGVTAQGGTIVRKFNVSGLRAILPTGAVPNVGASEVRGVQDLALPIHYVGIGFYGASDPAIVTSVGGNVRGFYDHTMVADVPDDGIPAIRRNPLVRYVELSLGGCFSVTSPAR